MKKTRKLESNYAGQRDTSCRGFLSDALCRRIRAIHATLGETDGGDLASWRKGFFEDDAPKREVALWENIACIYAEFVQGRTLSRRKKRDVVMILRDASYEGVSAARETKLWEITRAEADEVIRLWLSCQ